MSAASQSLVSFSMQPRGRGKVLVVDDDPIILEGVVAIEDDNQCPLVGVMLAVLLLDSLNDHPRKLQVVAGVFGLTPDYARRREGGSTDIALVPSLNALLYLLRNFGFSDLFVMPSSDDDYEQFRRGSRVVVYGGRSAPSNSGRFCKP